jgi:hypothetical protein
MKNMQKDILGGEEEENWRALVGNTDNRSFGSVRDALSGAVNAEITQFPQQSGGTYLR